MRRKHARLLRAAEDYNNVAPHPDDIGDDNIGDADIDDADIDDVSVGLGAGTSGVANGCGAHAAPLPTVDAIRPA